MPDKGWKAYERRISKYFGTTRNALSGMNSGVTASDTRHTKLFIDTKCRREFSKVVRYFKVIEGLAANESKVPMLITKIPHMKDEGSLVTVRLKDLFTIAGKGERRP